jgi:hypothetical protein
MIRSATLEDDEEMNPLERAIVHCEWCIIKNSAAASICDDARHAVMQLIEQAVPYISTYVVTSMILLHNIISPSLAPSRRSSVINGSPLSGTLRTCAQPSK